MRYWEEYGCGCQSKQSSKRDLAGYCGQHGMSTRAIYRADGIPGDARTREIHRQVIAVRGDLQAKTLEGA